MATLRSRLRALPSLPDTLPVLDPDAVPDDPLDLVRAWLDDAIASGERQPHAVTFTTIDDAGRPASRTLVLEDVDDRGLLVASSTASRKAHHLVRRPAATIHAFWRELGRQLEVTGRAVEVDEAASLADWGERPGSDAGDEPRWRVWALVPDRVEAMQATHDLRHVRVEYVRHADGWHRWRLDQGVGLR